MKRHPPPVIQYEDEGSRRRGKIIKTDSPTYRTKSSEIIWHVPVLESAPSEETVEEEELRARKL